MQGVPRSKLYKFENFGHFWLCLPKKGVNPNNIITDAHQEPMLPTVEHFKPLSTEIVEYFFGRPFRVISCKKY